jgi:protoporphyrin/coproporphyrin ferrochelatase
MPYLPEPAYTHGSIAPLGVLLVNLGTPEAPTAQALRPYLKQFLSDPRVVEIPRAVWWVILNGIVLNTRPAKSARKYAQIWTSEGSPLKVHTQRQALLLQDRFRQLLPGAPIAVEWAMRYGNPPVQEGLAALRNRGCDRVLVLPLYPQYAASTTASTYDSVLETLRATRNVPALRMLKQFHDHPAYIAALTASVREYWAAHGRPGRLLMSFHGVPRFSLDRGDPYHCQCRKTARLLAEALGLPDGFHLVTFQSRFGKAEWLRPYTMETIEQLGRERIGRVDVLCPGFVSDCLETLEEIAMENKAAFLGAGGQEFHYIPCLNERADWIDALAAIALQEMQGWVDEAADGGAERAAASRSRERALMLGAAR